ncbi:histidine ammonia-lyase [Pontibacter sp. G13]|uniref:histidine ammonia-lyase n=1 Tax=Pontibacter sp. G13 TaxID=3074898 RepID=UPI00288C460A|nr:histidine ammonia-lyase [Pontibacter sp. G13]WNJ17543.1 histidine ammonia-lyase [Pontibacter sp. G13]
MEISHQNLTIDQIAKLLASSNRQVSLSDSAKARIQECRDYLDTRLAKGTDIIYGINTGFGYLCDKEIAFDDQRQLQINLIRSHACGMGSKVPHEIVRLMLLLKVKSLCYGHSGVQVETVQRLIDFWNHDVLPVVYTQGSLGASGDLSPLAHLALPLIGEGEVEYQGQRMSAADMNAQMGWQPISLKAKEGLALLNGTQFMLAYGIHILLQGERLTHLGDRVAALSLDAFHGLLDPFHPKLHEIRPHPGQIHTAKTMLELLGDSEIVQTEKKHVQDPYSFRCIPQVHGASKDAIAYCRTVFERELSGVSDNPNIFVEEDLVLSGGNFHGQPLALALDFLAIALAELGSISERRTYQLISGTRGLPSFLVANPGLDSGMMIPQYTAASIASQNKQLCTPASVDTIPSSNNQEDHVSMGANAATKCLRVLDNLERLFAIELVNASQALHFREPKQTGTALRPMLADFRKVVPFVERDRILYQDLHRAVDFVAGWQLEMPAIKG